ncbi:MAG: AAA domain-containing protein [Chitinophagaceae bacterium]
MKATGIEFFNDLMLIHQQSGAVANKYPKMRGLLERVCKDKSRGEPIQFSNLFSRLNYVCEKYQLDRQTTYQINSFRIMANRVLHDNAQPTDNDYLQNLKALCLLIRHFYAVDIPEVLASILPEYNEVKPQRRIKNNYPRIRVEVSSWNDQFIFAFDEENSSEEPIKIKHHVHSINDAFDASIDELWKGCQLNLIDVEVDEDGVYIPEIIIVEPDYLIDISALAECMKDYGRNPLNYFQGKFEAIANSKYFLLGNMANLFLDELINEKAEAPVVYKEVVKKGFKMSPFEYATCPDITPEFFQNTQLHFENIKRVIQTVFPEQQISRENAILEPSFICETLGVQGRLDFLQLENNTGRQFVIELKSGKAPFPETNYELIGLNNRSQAFIYQIVVQKVLGVQYRNLKTYILYSKYTAPGANLRWSQPSMAAIKEILNIRNLIVANEKRIAVDTSNEASTQLIRSITPEGLVTSKPLTDKFIQDWIVPRINQFQEAFNQASPLALEYFHSFYTFVSKEHYISKAGDTDYDSNKGISSLWLSSLEEKLESGEILTDLTIIENRTPTDSPIIQLRIPEYEHNFLPNFRQGDIVILYERNNKEDNVTNKQVFKGSIELLSPTEITIRIRYKQRNQSVLPQHSKYAIEHDFLDSSYNAMCRGLYAFLKANNDRQQLFLNQRPPEQDEDVALLNGFESAEIQEIVLKAKKAKDYFLLIGPPGTGKTSLALKSMVEEFYDDEHQNILLLSYTNRAVDEICDALDQVKGTPPYIRIGSELSCEPKHRSKLLEKIIAPCETRDTVKAVIQQHRIFVGTVASLSNKTELFKLKHFQVAIIDEASQILEPSIIGLLCAQDANGANAIDKFILIGDHKQLPAVVLQHESSSKTNSEALMSIGISDRRNSLFERLYGLHKNNKQSPVWGMLHKQGRMHPDIALFPNYSFYNNQLQAVPTPHQTNQLNYTVWDKENPIHQFIATKRLGFIPSEAHNDDKTNKTNTYEAQIVQTLVKHIYDLYQVNGMPFSPGETLGVITPYRSQIALIKKAIHALDIPALNAISVDTVERFQGSQRDIIIYSFSINQYYQLDNLVNYIEDEGQLVDRKLNVAITRARKQLFVTGNPAILSNNLTYYRFIEFIRSKFGFIYEHPEQFLQGKFQVIEPDTDIELGQSVYEPDESFVQVFDDLVISPIKADARTQYPHRLYGYTNDYIRNNVIEFGRANFDQASIEHSSSEKVNLYCFYNMRKHYFTSMAIFKSHSDYFNALFNNSHHRITFIDIGCGPLTSGLAFQQSFNSQSHFRFEYIGIDTSVAMLQKAQAFAKSGFFSRDTRFQWAHSISEIDEAFWSSIFDLSNTVILNFSYLFGNIAKSEVEQLAMRINGLMAQFPLNKYVLVFQNSSIEKRNRSYTIFKQLVPRLQSIHHGPKIETVIYRNAILSNFDKSEDVYYELLSHS